MIRYRTSPPTRWTEQELVRDITELEDALTKYACRNDIETNWARTLVTKALQSRRQLLAKLRDQSR